MANTPYENFVLSNELTDQLDSHLNLERFCVIDRDLEGEAGMVKKVNVYKATGEAEKLSEGEGNSSVIEAGFTTKDYTIGLAQAEFDWTDEQEMKDPMVVLTGMKHLATSIYNTMQKDIYAEFGKATQTVEAAAFDFAAFTDAVALLNFEDESENVPEIFAFINNKDKAEVKKALKDDLKYVEAYARRGYVGSVAGVNIYTKKNATAGTIVGGVKGAVKLFVKKRSEAEKVTKGNRDKDSANKRKNSAFGRSYYVAALVDETKAFKITKGE